jgi:hypothetical protein
MDAVHAADVGDDAAEQVHHPALERPQQPGLDPARMALRQMLEKRLRRKRGPKHRA